MKQISLRLPEDEWSRLKTLVFERIGLPISDNYAARRLIEAGADAMAVDANKYRKLKVRKGRL